MMINKSMNDVLHIMPKVELHVHLDGSVKASTIRELAESRADSSLPESDDELLSLMQADPDTTSLTQYLSKFSFVLPYMQTAEAIERIAYELVEQAAEQQVRYMEVRFAPWLHTHQGLSIEDAIRHTVNGLRSGEEQFGTVARAIVICMRNHSFEQNIEAIEAASLFYAKGVVAVDLAGDEASYPAHQFAPLFERAKALKLPITIHAGEAAGAFNVRAAVEELGAMRIGHGVRMEEDPAVIELVKAKKIPLEMCPISNIQTKAVEGWTSYPLRKYIEEGIIVTVNTDNMTVSDTTITKEYTALMEYCGLTLNDIAALVMNGVKAAFLEDGPKAELVKRFELELSELGLQSAVY
ncbi:adenosine deaminase [Paenibacillus harenae]|uniref:adenosine deaminase n=1 Tax=Paenibacillus harenae TaxID=306543 RepID=A0ABT9U9F6_PAEHA|nr:adenosine deaminase [Paenibacillus harenae]MDQ0116280.1 adenosine deaminase [Paenibacillus harenae]